MKFICMLCIFSYIYGPFDLKRAACCKKNIVLQ